MRLRATSIESLTAFDLEFPAELSSLHDPRLALLNTQSWCPPNRQQLSDELIAKFAEEFRGRYSAQSWRYVLNPGRKVPS
jgi:hypothetical protein